MRDESVNAKRRRELGRFLRSRRARLRPHDVGLPPGAGHRRVTGYGAKKSPRLPVWA